LPTSITDLSAAPLSLNALLLNLALGAILSLLLSWTYVRFGRSLSNRAALARIFPLITLTTILIISVVKSSLALSLGLVGALSIVRFRTPIKEPEELGYLFACIATGLALGADQRIAAGVGIPLILLLATLTGGIRRGRKDENLFLNVAIPQQTDTEAVFARINAVLAQHVQTADVRRLDSSRDEFQATYTVHCDHNDAVIAAMDALRQSFPDASISFIEQHNSLGG